MVDNPISRYLEERLDEYLDDLRQIVNIDSGTHDKDGVDQVATIMEGKLRDLGCEVYRLPNQQYGDSVVGTLEGNGGNKVVMVGHMDTVYPKGTAARRPFRVDGDQAFGPGVSDMKNGVLAGLYAMRALKETGSLGFGEVVFFLNPDEEVGSPTSQQAIDLACEGAAAAFVLESARQNGAMVVGRKGVCAYRITAHGRSAHAGVNPDRGRSAILQLAHTIIEVSKLNGLTKGATVNVGTVMGGTRPNVVAETASCEVDIRVPTVEARDRIQEALREAVARTVVPDTTVEIERADCDFPPMERNERNEALFERAKQVADRLGIQVSGVETGGGSDANHISAIGVPVLDGLGPIGANAHSPEECLQIPSVVPRTSLLAHLIVEVGR